MRSSFIQKISLFTGVIILTMLSTPVFAINKPQVDRLVKQAEALSLAKHPTWLALLHYKRESLLRRFVSQVDDDKFFLAKQGRTNAQAELNADIRGFFEAPHSRHAQCIFPARWWWLKQQLNISDENNMRCPLLETFMTRVAHDKLFLVFPSMYMNNPGSIFGHTFLRFDAKGRSMLFSKTLNYAADVDKEDSMVSYVSKGLFGGYNGYFQLRPYYKTVQEYSNIENRDIWEYQLNFSAAEIKQLVRHYWEIKDIDIDYYFLRENCAYRLLALLDVIRPNMNLTTDGNFSIYAIPVDTVRALKNKNIITKSVYRASLETKINHYFSNHNSQQTDTVLAILASKNSIDENEMSKLLNSISSDNEKIKILQQSYRLLQFKRLTQTKKAQLLLSYENRLSRNKKQNINAKKNQTEKLHNKKTGLTIKPPEQSHRSMRVALTYGKQNNYTYTGLKWRPSFHDLVDAGAGFVDGAEINVLDFEFRAFKNESIKLQTLRLFNVKSLAPISQWKKPISWLLDFKLNHTQINKNNSARSFVSKAGAGYSFKKWGLNPYILATSEINVSSDYEKGYSALLGLQTGLRFSLNHNQFLLQLEKQSVVAGFLLDNIQLIIKWQYNFSVNHALRLQYKEREYNFFNDETTSLSYQYYF